MRKEFESRISFDELKEKGIIKNGPNKFQANCQSLVKAQKMDKLKHKLERRASLEEIKQQKIFKTSKSIKQDQQRRSTTENIIDQHIQKVVHSKN